MPSRRPWVQRTLIAVSRALVVALLAAACERHHPPPPVPQKPVPVEAAPSVAPPPKALGGAELAPLTVPGFADAIVSLPVGTTKRRPIVVACHGNYDRPEWQCATWRSILGDARAFVLCPRGVPRPDSPAPDDPRFTYASADAMAKELDAGLAALRAAYPDFVDDGAMIYTGFSLGAIYGVTYVLRDPSRFPRLVLTEGSHGNWTSAAVNAFAKKGGERVLFACGQPSCVTMATTVANVMKKVAIDTKVVHGKGVGHGYTGPVADEIAAVLPWLIDDRFKQ
jgi:hypothetical protein